MDVDVQQSLNLRWARALEQASGHGVPHVILDGKINPAASPQEKMTSVNGAVIDL